MKEYEQHRRRILQIITAREAPPTIRTCSVCASSEPWNPMKWRCEDCFGRPAFCSECLRKSHSLHPFHRVSRWDGECFTRSTLEKAGVTLNLGHAGQLCPKYRVRKQSAPVSRSQHSASILSPPGPATPIVSNVASQTRNAPPQFHLLSDNLRVPDLAGDRTRTELADLADEGTQTQSTDHADQSQPPSQEGMGREALPTENDRFYHDLFEWRMAHEPPPSEPDLDVEPDPFDPINQQIHSDPFFAGESEDEDDWRSAETGGIPLKNRSLKRADDKYSCPILTVVDITGIHQIRTRFCRCTPLVNIPLSDQLLRMGLFPSSMKKTRTVFTFRVLDDCHLANLEGKVSTFKYYNKLKRLTSNAFPSMGIDRYREFLRALRQWRDVRVRQRAGEAFQPAGHEIPIGGLAQFCPTCPQPGVNLPADWESDTKR